MTTTEFLFLILGMGIVTFVPRWIPLQYLSNRDLPEWFTQWLDLLPVAILSSLILPALVTTGVPRHLDFLQPGLWVALPTFLFALKTKSLGGTVLVGMLLFWFAEKIL